VSYEELPAHLVQAIISSEDENFLERDGVSAHNGVDLKGIARAAVYVLKHRHSGPGGSTISMQVVKNIAGLEKGKGKLGYKLAQWLLAWKLEDKFSKQDIMILYWNWAYLGGGRVGPIEASKFYWGKDLSELTLAQCAMLAGMVQSPERLRPDRHPEAARVRRAYVLNRMHHEGFITTAQRDEALSEEFNLIDQPQEGDEGGWAKDMALSILEESLDKDTLRRGGIRVYLTINSERQREARDAIVHQLAEVDERQGFADPLHKSIPQSQVVKPASLVLAKVQKVEDDPENGFLYLDLGGGLTGQIRLRNLSRYYRISEEDRNAYKKAQKQWQRDLRKWERAQKKAKAKSGEKPTEPEPAKERFRWSPGDVIQAQVIEPVAGKKNHVWVRPEMGPQAAMVHLDPQTHEIRALVCGDSYSLSRYNRCLSALQPGSTFKPLGVYLTALDMKVFTPWGTADRVAPQRLIDEPYTCHYRIPWADGKGFDEKEWSPGNYGGKYREGPMTLREGLAGSVNSIAAQLICHEDIGYEMVTNTLRRVGITSALAQGPSIALGGSEVSPLELATAYATVASGGIHAKWRLIDHIESLGGDEIEIEATLPSVRKREFSEAVMWLLRNMMRSVVTDGSGARLKNFPLPVAGKTGTTNQSKSTWFIGVLPEAVVVSWVGFDNAAPLKGRARRAETGASAALPIVKSALESMWNAGFFGSTEDRPEELNGFGPPPEGVVCVPFDFEHGMLLETDEPDPPKECFLEGTEPTEPYVEPTSVDPGPPFIQDGEVVTPMLDNVPKMILPDAGVDQADDEDLPPP